jgi:hypothetical protein
MDMVTLDDEESLKMESLGATTGGEFSSCARLESINCDGKRALSTAFYASLCLPQSMSPVLA